MSYLTTDNFDKKIAYNLKAIDLMIGNHRELSRLYYNHSTIYGGESEFNDKTKKYLKLAYLSSLKSDYYLVQAASLGGLAYFNIQENKLDSAKINLEKGLLLCEKTKLPQICYEVNKELGKLYGKLEMFDKANDILLVANNYALIRKRKYDIIESNVYLAKNEIKRGNYNASIIYFEKAEIVFIDEPVPEIGVAFYRSWAEAEKKIGNYRKSNELLEKSIQLKDSVYSQENRAILVNADAKYETEKKDKEIALQQLQLEKTERELQKRKTQSNYLIGIVTFLLVGSILIWFLFQQRQKRKNQEIVTLKREHQIKTLETLIEGEEKERFRIAKELHDGVNGDLSAIKYKLSTLLEMNNTIIKEAIIMIDNSCNQVRAISHNLVPPSLENFNLLEAVEEYCEKSDTSHTEKITFQHLGDEVNMLKKEEINIFRIIQELVTNSIKHANATEINVQISCRNKTMQITVEDNGKGFDKEKAEGKGIGLVNIQSRIDYLHGTIDLITNNQGTSTTIEIDKNTNGNN
jgi:signal transduction histidine kinase